MRAALFLMIVAGVGVGALVPVKHNPPARAATAVAGEAKDETPRDTVIERDSNGHFFAYGDVGGQQVRFLIDTGADMVALTVEDARRAGVKFNPYEFEYIGTGASGPIRGERVMLDSVSLDGKKIMDVHAAVIEGLDVSLLGQSYLRRIDAVQLNGDKMVLK